MPQLKEKTIKHQLSIKILSLIAHRKLKNYKKIYNNPYLDCAQLLNSAERDALMSHRLIDDGPEIQYGGQNNSNHSVRMTTSF